MFDDFESFENEVSNEYCPFCGYDTCEGDCVADDDNDEYFDDERAVDDTSYRDYEGAYDPCLDAAFEDRFEVE